MKKAIVFVICLIGICPTRAQVYVDNQGNIFDQKKLAKENANNPSMPKKSLIDRDKLEFGGNFGLQFGDYTHLSISPQVGYKVSKYATLGLGLGYNYLSTREYGAGYRDKYSAITVGTYARFYPVEPIVLSLQPEISRVWISGGGGGSKYSDSGVAPALLLGGGVMYQGMMMMIQYDVVQNKYSPYGSGIFYTAGFYFDL